MAAETTFRAMGSEAHVVVVGGPPGLLDQALARVDELERRWSRFLPDSEVSSLNRAAGRPVVVSPDTAELVARAVDAWRISGGSFDPTVLEAVVGAGYDRSFDELEDRPAPGPPPAPAPGAGAIEVDGTVVRLPPGTGFDPGGIGKGLAADLVAAGLLAAGACGACVNLGGDVRVAGTAPGGGPWTIAVEHPWQAEPLALVGAEDGAVATSTTLKRRWTFAGKARHHLIDPSTGAPSDTGLNLVTVVAGRAWVAEVLAKAVLLAGARNPFSVLQGTGAEALAVGDDGRVQWTPGLVAYLGDATLPASLPST
ncbi:MAG TPA: FAD:protein FMN transferase [Acidimicrobiales bacterium]|nr:FAD:protein FMN transferase [Acidimicrobiales bacterium]